MTVLVGAGGSRNATVGGMTTRTVAGFEMCIAFALHYCTTHFHIEMFLQLLQRLTMSA